MAGKRLPSLGKAGAERPVSGFARLTRGPLQNALFILAMVVAGMIGTVSTAGAQTVPGAPTGLSASANGTTQVDLSWTAPTDTGGTNITDYKIEYFASLTGTEWAVLVENTGNTVANYSHEHAIAPGTELKYRVSAINSVGVGNPSDAVDVTTPQAPDAQSNGVPGLIGVTVSEDKIVLMFNEDLDTASVPEAVQFLVKIKDDALGVKEDDAPRVKEVEITAAEVTLTLPYPVTVSDRVNVLYFRPRILIGNGLVDTTRKALKDTEGNLVEKIPFYRATNITPQVALVLMPDSISENGGVSAVTAKLPSAALADLTVTVNAEGVAPAVSADFELSQNTVLMILANNSTSTGTVEITAVDNNAAGADKMITVTATVSGSMDVLTKTPPATLTIVNDEISRFVPTLITSPLPPTGAGTADRAALVALYNATGGGNWTVSTDWNTRAPLGQWYGVTTDSEGRVTELVLGGNRLSGTIPPELGSLWGLKRLYLNDNQLTGAIPLMELEAMVTAPDSVLRELALWGNDQLTGTEDISDELGRRVDLAVLRTLYEGNGGLQWEDDENWLNPADLFTFSGWYGVMTNDNGRVSALDLAGNGLRKEITNALEALDNLEALDLSGNADLNGTLPLGLMDLSELDMLYVQDTGVCAPEDSTFQQWLADIDFRGENCVTDVAGENEFGAGGGGCVIVSDGRIVSAPESATLNLLLIISVLIMFSRGNLRKARHTRP